ncbi:protein AF-17-like isoform X2 [Panonychus citri]|uniref:protein AF-17-like isoform X2 n=1 Tax=Panonychus citri TaxID=50023 RepID=UPI002307B9C9|nr:protein AF-17-like isoform X2 [Panonychus citri]
MKEMVGGCCVCSDERGWTENPLVYCDGNQCSVAVHQACYGIVQVPTGPWFCRKCESQERQARVRCELCPSKDGALKRTDTGGWAHVVCSLYIPEVRFGNVSTMEPIILALVPPDRFHKTCYICEEQGKESKASIGACMQCNKPGCKHHFHVTCAQAAGLLCEEAGNFNDNVKYCGYCAYHYQKLPVPVTESTPETSPDKKIAGQSGISSLKPTSPSEVSKPPKKKVSKPLGSNLSTSLVAGSSTINNLPSNNPGSSNSLGKPNLTINPEILKSRHESYGLTDNAVGPTFPGSRSSTGGGGGGDHGSDNKSNKNERKKKKSSQYVISSASQSPAGQSNSPNPVINNHPKESLANHSSSQASSPNPTPSFTAMYGSLTAKEPSTSSSGEKKEKSKREIEDDSSTETEDDEEDKPPIPKKMRNSTAAEKKMKKPLAIPKCNKTPKVTQKDAISAKKTKRKKDDILKEINTDTEPDRSATEKPSNVAKAITETQTSSKITPPSSEVSPATVTSSAPNGHASQTTPLTRSPITSVVKDFALPAPPTKPKQINVLKEPLPDGPQTLEQLLERQWASGAQMIMEQSQHFDVASLLSCLHQLRSENERLEEKVRHLVARRDHLIAVNSRLSLPLNGSLNPPLTSIGGFSNHSSAISQNGSGNSVSSSPLSFPSSNSGANPSPLYDNNKSPRTSPASNLPNGSSARAPNHISTNGEVTGSLPQNYNNLPPQFNMTDPPTESPFYQMMNAAQQQNTPNFQHPLFRGPDKR